MKERVSEEKQVDINKLEDFALKRYPEKVSKVFLGVTRDYKRYRQRNEKCRKQRHLQNEGNINTFTLSDNVVGIASDMSVACKKGHCYNLSKPTKRRSYYNKHNSMFAGISFTDNILS